MFSSHILKLTASVGLVNPLSLVSLYKLEHAFNWCTEGFGRSSHPPEKGR